MHVRANRPRCRALTIAATIAIALASGHASAQSAANVLLVINTASAESDAVGRHYISRRGVPSENVCLLVAPTTETVTRAAYESQIEQPIWKCIITARAHDRILYIVLTKGVPIRISGTGGRSGTNASVDSELTLLYRRHTGRMVPIVGFVPNPYFAGSAAIDTIKPFAHDRYDIYLVTRLDGYSVHDVETLIDKGVAPVRDGRFILDGRSGLVDPGGDAWLRTAAQRLREQGIGDRVVLDQSTKVLTQQSKVLGYYSWGSNDPAIHQRHFDLEFVPGALVAEFVSTDARTFKEPPATWLPANAATKESIYAGSHQSLIGDLIRDGATGAAGHVDEPYLDATIRPDILFPAYVSGRNLAEAFYAAMPYLSWQTLVIGDPLCAPFDGTHRTANEIDPGMDADTELPSQFAAYQLAALPAGVKPTAAAAFVRATSRGDRGDVH
ncbi:MAG TPA: TIGR03790 family protein, partial [Vicinamibacterales bacterium]|nr:TIGR03790 family protein [Vicinamibacterales bacterium]